MTCLIHVLGYPENAWPLYCSTPRQRSMCTAIVALSAVVAAISFALLYPCLHAVFHRNGRLRELSLPPGLPRLPILGNYFNIPTTRPWETYRDLCSKLGKSCPIFTVGP
ncbi:hypothetical protein BD311DRAFT_537513 [Dichomitus squalens]|uniref:Cytochrome P450 n=1 Tax=Dichomitus squalens TaxID=114155 RepID=A0A4Q9MC57_9APHY|nr:hypothetical protein BD311DRAFT_537513 [Dichomitus squalens]